MNIVIKKYLAQKKISSVVGVEPTNVLSESKTLTTMP